jgi:hypothetical protein
MLLSARITLAADLYRDLQAQQGTLPLNKNAQYEFIPASNGGFLVAEITHLEKVQRSQVKSYNLAVHTSDFENIRNFGFVKSASYALLMYYQTQKVLSFKKLYSRDFY